jgi:hypothetical protein
MNIRPNLGQETAEGARIAGQYSGVFEAPPRDSIVPHTPGGPLLGNGDVWKLEPA